MSGNIRLHLWTRKRDFKAKYYHAMFAFFQVKDVFMLYKGLTRKRFDVFVLLHLIAAILVVVVLVVLDIFVYSMFYESR